MVEKIAIIKLGALGDVVRTLPVLPAIKEKYPHSKIKWITKESSHEMLETHPHIDAVLTVPMEEIDSLDEFDVLFNFDIDEEATNLAKKIKANKKLGFFSDEGFVSAFNLPAEYYLNTLFDDELKKSNRKTYQQMMFEAAELPYDKHHSTIHLSEEDKEYAKKFAQENNLDIENLIGIHMGASSRWPSKVWARNKIKEFIRIAKEKGYNIMIFAGSNEKQQQQEFVSELAEQGIKVYKNNPDNTIRQFAALVELCKVMVCSDSLSMHIALALRKPTIGLFFCTSPHEVEDYGLLKKVVSPKLSEFFPERMDQYDEDLVNSINPEEVLKQILELENGQSS